MRTQDRYVMGEGEDDHGRLRDQAVVLDPLTERFLADAGIGRGMRVLDLGTGAGSVAAIAADLVGEEGSVLAVDRDPTALDAARTALADRPQIAFAEADLRDLDINEEFDAVVGRAVLMYLSDPAPVLARIADHVRPGGLVCLHEFDLTHEWTSARTPLWETVRTWMLEVLARAGADARMGPKLFATFRAAGLPEPRLSVDAPAGGGGAAPIFGWTNALAAVVPALEEMGIASAEEIGIDTLTERLGAEIDEADGMVLGPMLYGAGCAVA
ncbi:class I SAM-dependent methyltransferase [Brevibacterium renqingii]|uniref:class I SAM-dependent methyltransferase n=1 Tax=Brevibacterium renqingii TaxID=2776916 RepID=UPI001ADEC6E6|nr:methyltransferase domain-containing protein [Brevibacterium renqingii]